MSRGHKTQEQKKRYKETDKRKASRKTEALCDFIVYGITKDGRILSRPITEQEIKDIAEMRKELDMPYVFDKERNRWT